ncbi:unnamed protein product, partial [Ilex paraguariensis]
CLTHFPDIAYLLTKLKILNKDLELLALSSAMFCDMLGISLTVVGFAALQAKNDHPLNPLWGTLSSIALVVARAAILQILKRKPEGEPIGESLISAIFIIVLIIGFLSETIGQHYVLGSLVLV